VVETDFGAITLVLYPEAAPRTVDLMRTYAREGYYAGREFNRVMPGHVIQVIDKAGGATEDGRRIPLEAHPAYHFSAGAVGIARGEATDSGGPEFFVMDFATSHLDGNYTVWGQVVDGLDVVHRIARVPTVDLTPVPLISSLLVDRQAVQAVAIRAVREVVVERTPSEWSRLPLQVARNVRMGDWRHSLQWDADLTPGGESNLTWFVRTSNASNPAPAASQVAIRVGHEVLPVVGEPEASGKYTWRWRPESSGATAAILVVAGQDVAELVVHVPDRTGATE
jgi:cyclophilin family peptidyl-prolyl cis-trans isomerase